MDNKPTHVLVLGAGASMAYGFPSGMQLTKLIIDGTKNNTPLTKFLKNLSWGVDAINNFGREFEESNQYSIDRFLSNRKEFVDIGKASIAYLISERERINSLSIREPQNWYAKLFNDLVSNFSKDQILNDKKIFSNLAFLTFNYDRSLEQCLFQSFKSSFNLNENETAAIINRFEIKHIHGSLGKLPWQCSNSQDTSYKYEHPPESQYGKIQSMSLNIKLAEHRQIDESVAKTLNNAQKVHFLGFSYDPQNMNILGINWRSKSDCELTGTSLELSKFDLQRIEEQTNHYLKLYNVYIHQYWNDHVSLW